MEQETGLAGAIRGFVRWSITPPQSYVVYLACLFLVAGLSFYVGTLKPNKAAGVAPTSMSPTPAVRN